MSNDINKTVTITSLWKFLENNEIQIPIIQRDYAQGRTGNEYVRKPFLDSLKEHIEDGTILKFDFVYGTEPEENIFEPLDGQQRLTSLWLFHFYVLFKRVEYKGEINVDKKRLLHFTYLTRDSSKDFCRELINQTIVRPNNNKDNEKQENIEKNKKYEKLSYLIQNQLWFFKQWGSDPTIKAMLNMLDSIDEQFNDPDLIESCYKHLFIDDDIVKFYVLNVDNVTEPDELYIKMNARGKPLTDFENFKSDFIDYIKETDISSKLENKTHEDMVDEIALKLDTSWADLFWKYRLEIVDKVSGSKEVSIDEIYYSFINRIFFCFLTETEYDNNKLGQKHFTENALDETTNDIDKFLINAKNVLYETKGYTNKYKAFDTYHRILDDTPNCITKIINIFDRCKKIIEDKDKASSFINFTYNPYEKNNDKNKCSEIFIPHQLPNKDDDTNEHCYETTKIEQQYYPVFYGLILYLINNETYDDQSKFADWMRIIWNICTLSDLKTIDAVLSLMQELNKLAIHSNDIVSYISEDHSFLKDIKLRSFLYRQFNEEVIKATIIKKYPDHESTIRELENYGFFEGSIDFMFDYKTADEVTIDDNFIKTFDKRYKIIKELFEQDNDNNKVLKNDKPYLANCRSYILGTILRLSSLKIDNIKDVYLFDYEKNKRLWQSFMHDETYNEAIIRVFNFLQDKNLENITIDEYDNEYASLPPLNPKDDATINSITKDLCLIRHICNNLHNYQIKEFYKTWKIVIDNPHDTSKDKQRIVLDTKDYRRHDILLSLEDSPDINIDDELKIDECKGFYNDLEITFSYSKSKYASKYKIFYSLVAGQDKLIILSSCKEYDKWGFPLDYSPDRDLKEYVINSKDKNFDIEKEREIILGKLPEFEENVQNILEENRKKIANN